MQALKDGVAAAATLLRHPELVTGGGSAEAAVHSALQSHIHTESQGLESRVMEAWADAVLSIVVTLAENAGVNAAAAQVPPAIITPHAAAAQVPPAIVPPHAAAAQVGGHRRNTKTRCASGL